MTSSRGNDTTSITPEGDPSWLPLAIALPVCLIGIPLVTVIVIVLITCYRSKFRSKEISVFDRKLNEETGDQNEAVETQNEAVGNRTEDPASSNAIYVNLPETVEEAKRNEAKRNAAMGNSSPIGIAKSLHWPLKTPWKRQTVNMTENAEVEKVPAADVTDHKERHEEEEGKAEEEVRMMDEASDGTRKDWTVGRRRKTAEAGAGEGDLQVRPRANGQALLDVSAAAAAAAAAAVRKNETTTTTTPKKNPTADNKTTTTTKPKNRKTFVVMYSMDSNKANHLSLAVNDVIFFMDEEKDGWMKGEKKESGEIGWFPRTHVREGMSPLVKKHSTQLKRDAPSAVSDTRTTTTATTKVTTMTSSQQCGNDNDAFEDFDDDDDDYETGIEYQALYPYRATEDGDINFDAGDVIVVVEKQDTGWWRGYHGDDHGFFPGSYVQILGDVEFSQSLLDLPQVTGDSSSSSQVSSSRAAGDVRRLVDPELLFSVAEEEDVDDDYEALQQKQNKNKKKNARKSLGLFLTSLPRKITTSSKAGSGGSHGPSDVVTPDPDPLKTKKSGRIVIRGVKKKNKTKNDRSLAPMTRRSSLAPRPPQSGRQGEPLDAFAKSVMSGLAQMVAAEAQLRNDPLNTTYEEIAVSDFFDPTTSEANLSESRRNLLHEDRQPFSSRDVMTEAKSSTLAVSSLVRGAKRHDISSSSSSSSKATTETYSNLASAVRSAAEAAKDSISVRRQVTTGRDSESELSNKQQSQQTTFADGGPSSRKPVPPRKPNYIGSTPDIAALSSPADLRTVRGPRRSPGQKPRPLAKAARPKSGEVGGHDLGLTGAEYDNLRRALPQSEKPKPLKEKPHYLSPGLPQGVAPKSDHHMQRRDISRSLDSILVAVEAEDGTTDEDEAAGELGIMKWLQRKLSAEDELTDGRGTEGGGTGGGGEKGEGGGIRVTGNGKSLQQMQIKRADYNSDGTTRNVQPKDRTRIVLMVEGLSKDGIGEESFV